MPTQLFGLTRDAAFYERLRDAFVTRVEKPTHKELSEEFVVPMGTVATRSADENWVALRAAYFEKQAKDGDVLALLIEATKFDRRIVGAVTDVALAAFAQLAIVLSSIPDDRASSTRADIIQTCSFALKNLCDAVKSVGIVGVSKTLPGLGKEDNGRWNPEMLQQINVTVQNLQAAAKSEAPGESGPAATPVRKPTGPTVDVPSAAQSMPTADPAK